MAKRCSRRRGARMHRRTRRGGVVLGSGLLGGVWHGGGRKKMMRTNRRTHRRTRRGGIVIGYI